MKKFIFGTLMLIFITFACFAAKPVVSYKGCQKLAKKHNMTVITETDKCFYAECESSLTEQKFYVLYYNCEPYTDGDIKLKYHRADLLIKLNKDRGIFIPKDKREKYKLDDVDKLKYKLDVIAGRIESDE